MHLYFDQRLSDAIASYILSIRLVVFKDTVKTFRVLYFFFNILSHFVGA